MLTTMRFLISSLITFAFSFSTYAALYDRGNGMIYDSTQNITWMQDFRFANAGFRSDFQGVSQLEWADQLVYGGYSDWRLPSIRGVKKPDCDTDYELCHSFDLVSDTELGHLLIVDLGNYQNGETYKNPDDELNLQFVDGQTGELKSFRNLTAFDVNPFDAQDYAGILYWFSEGITSPSNSAFYGFHMTNGSVVVTNSLNDNFVSYAIAVRDGDVIQTPLPASYGIFLLSLLSLFGIKWRHKI